MPFHQAELGTLVKAHYGKALKKENRNDAGVFDVYGSSGQVGFHIESICDYPTLVVGRKGSVGDIVWAPKGGWVIDTAYFLEVLNPDILDLRYLFYALKRANLANKTITTSIPGLNRDDFYETKISLPPLAEQKRIAAILDKADSLRRKNQQTIQLADQFLRAVFLDMFGDPVTNPKKWEVKKLKEMSHIQIGPFGTQLHKEDYIEGGIPLINPTHIVNGKIVSNMNYTIPSNKHAELDEYHLKAGDIIMGRRGEMGRCAVVTEQENGWLCGTGSLFIRTYNAEIFAEYLCTLLSGKTIKSYLEAESQGATMSNLNKTIVGNINIPVPSENALKKYSIIQEKIMKNINKMDCFSGELLFNSLSQKAFAGKL
jgi:type I restriction enzyme S subunit